MKLLVDMRVDCWQRFEAGLDAITEPAFAALSRAIGAAKYLAAVFHTVADDFATAMVTLGRHNVDRALEAVEDVRFSLETDLKYLVVFVSAMFAFSHKVYSILTFCFR
jgi:hypothetical protein